MCSKFASSKFASSKIKNKKALIKLNVRLTFSSFLFCRSSQIKCSCQSASLCFLTKGQVVSVQSWEPTGFPGVAAQSTNTSEGCFNKSNYLERSLTELLTVWNKYLLPITASLLHSTRRFYLPGLQVHFYFYSNFFFLIYFCCVCATIYIYVQLLENSHIVSKLLVIRPVENAMQTEKILHSNFAHMMSINS